MSLSLQCEIVTAVLLVVCVLSGYHQGLLKSIYSIIRFFLALILSAILVPVIIPLIPESVIAKQVVAFIVVFIVLNILLSILGHVLGWVNKVPVIGKINKIAGAFFGVAKGVLIIWFVLSIISCFSHVEWCAQTWKAVHQSQFLSWIDHQNPIAYLFEKMRNATL